MIYDKKEWNNCDMILFDDGESEPFQVNSWERLGGRVDVSFNLATAVGPCFSHFIPFSSSSRSVFEEYIGVL